MAIEIMPVRKEHLPQLERKILDYNQAHADKPLAVDTHLKAARKSLRDESNLFLVAIEKGSSEIAGYAYAETLYRTPHIALSHWTVSLRPSLPGRKGSGIGTALLKEKLLTLTRRGVSTIHGEARSEAGKTILNKASAELGLKLEQDDPKNKEKFVLRVNGK